jgi:hypothetical protein
MTRETGFGALLAASLLLAACGPKKAEKKAETSHPDAGGSTGTAGTGGTVGGAGAGGAGATAGGRGGDGAGAGGAAGDAGGGAGGATAGAGGTAGVPGTAGAAGGAGAGNPVGGTGGTAAQTCDGFNIPPDHPAADAYDTTAFGVVLDAKTGLAWQRAAIGDDPNWMSAGAHCTGLILGGVAGWRSPSILELASIVDMGATTPAIDATAFPDTPPSWFATSTGVYLNGQRVGGPYWFHTIDFGSGFTVNGMPNSGSVRCVRSATPLRCYAADGRFTATSSSGVAVVLDAATTLTWQRGTAPGMLAWAAAAAYCTSLGGFRLPGAKELLSLVDWKTVGVAIDATAFPGTPAGEFWSSSRAAGSTTDAVMVDFGHSDSARTGSEDAGSLQNVRCVR